MLSQYVAVLQDFENAHIRLDGFEVWMSQKGVKTFDKSRFMIFFFFFQWDGIIQFSAMITPTCIRAPQDVSVELVSSQSIN